jgi:hypothetical protein
MRELFFEVSPDQAKIGPSSGNPRVFGIATDWPVRGNIATITSFADGTASLYMNTGYVVAGGYSATAAAKKYVAQAEVSLDQAVKTNEHPYPPMDEVRFYIRTFGALYVIREPVERLLSRRSKHEALFLAANQVMTELFEAAEKAQAAEKAKK